MLMQDEFDGRDEVIFIEYDKVIKNSDQFLIGRLGKELKELYAPFLATEVLEHLDNSNALGLTMIMKHHNLFESLRRDELPEGWIHSYIDLYKAYDEMYDNCDLLSIGSNLFLLAAQKFTKKIILWSPFEDQRIPRDILNRHGEVSKIEYAYGDLKEVFESQPDKITSFIVANQHILPYIKEYSKVDYSEVLLASYRFNMFREENSFEFKSQFTEEFFEDKIVKFAIFEPFKIAEHHLNKIIKKDTPNI